MDKIFSYFYGVMQTDGSLYETTRNRGKLVLEISERDEDLIYLLDKIIDEKHTISKRERVTNFSNNEKKKYISIGYFDFFFRNKIKSFGFPVGKKSSIIEPPINEPFSEIDYVRGLIDGDGSLGITSNNIPFLSLVTASDKLKNFYIDFLFKIINKKKNINRNKRDNIYNIMVTKEDAQKVVSVLYYDKCNSMNRKKEKAIQVIDWVRPASMIKKQ
jgi:hypothetical protein